MPEFIPSRPQPSHPDRIRVVNGAEGSFYTTASYSLVALDAGAVFCAIEGATPGPHDAWNTVATGPDTRIELNSDLTYTNHSCDPSLVFDMQRMEVRVASHRPLRQGDELTFFYPSTEWEMAQPFACRCGAAECLGEVYGAKSLDAHVLNRHWLNEHIRTLLLQQRNIKVRYDNESHRGTFQHV